MTNEKDPEPPKGEQRTLRLTEFQGMTVALAQRIHNDLAGQASALIQQGQAKQNEATATLRAAVEGAFREHKSDIPTAEVKIVNDERGRPAVFVWTDPPAAEETEAPATEGETDEAAPAESAPAKPSNGKHPPEAAKRKLPIK